MVVQKVLLGSTAVLVFATGLVFQSGAPKTKPQKQTLVDQALDYKKLTLIDLELRKATDLSITFCRNIVGAITPHEVIEDPKAVPMLRVYADSASVALARNQKKGDLSFPIGSIFVKEKFFDRSSTAPHLLTVMKKTKPGRGADKWAFEMINFKTKKATKPARSAPTCVQCHSDYKATDGISTETFKVMKALK